MSDLKPCLICNVQPGYHHFEDLCWLECPECDCQANGMCDSYDEADAKWNELHTRPTPELPDGYRVEDHGNGGETLWTPQGHPLMVWGMDGSVEGWYSVSFNTDVTEEAAEHAQALAIWLQRRSK